MRSDEKVWVDRADAQLLERLHGGFPLVDRPFAQVASELHCSEDEVIERLTRLLAHGVLTRFGPLFQIERAGGCFVLAAMAVPDERFDAVARAVNAWPEVAHNYRRESAGHVESGPHRGEGAALNMWFVVAAESAAAAEAVLQHIEAETGLVVWRFPKEREFKVELRLPIAGVVNDPV
jgi:DNA-binding Lrp family transcriptional regulator